MLLLSFTFFPTPSPPPKKPFKLPNSLLTISNENTYPNPSHHHPILHPTKLPNQFLHTSHINIQNSHL
ncbi:YfkD family protein, partial [Bacillus velezensis]|uniref:YfkD family protein n=1 Tax=Bacillus velezensis TaxID=492670 RepID=UPI0021BD37D4